MKAQLIDTHCHLEMDEFDKDRDKTIRRAKDAGVEYIINIGSDRAGNIHGLKVCSEHPEVYAAVGIHPHDAKTLN